MFISALINNLSLLFVLCILYGLLYRRWRRSETARNISMGILFGLMAVIGMMNPVQFSTGIIFDGRSVILGLSGLFGGLYSAVFSACIAGLYRFYLGGSGAWTGMLVIICSALIGVAYKKYKKDTTILTILDFLLVGVAVHIAMLLLMLTLPGGLAYPVLKEITVPVLLVYPAATVLLGRFLFDQKRKVETEIELAESYRSLDSALSTTSFPIVITSESGGKILYRNDAFKNDYFASDEDPVGHSVLEIYHAPAERRKILSGLEASGGNYQFEFKARLHNGELRDYLVAASRMTYRSEKAILSIATDITEQNKIAGELRESEKKLRAIFEQSAVGIAIVSPEGKWERANRSLCDFLGYGIAELTARTFQDITYHEDLDENLEQVALLLEGKITSYSMEKRYIHKSGKLVWGRLTVSLVRDDDKRPSHFISIVEDISSRKAAENVLMAGEEYVEDIFKTADLGISQVYTKTGLFETINQKYCDIVGYSMEEMRRTTFMEITHPDDLGLDLENMELLKNKQSRGFSMEKRYIHRNGDHVWVNMTVLPMWKESEEPSRHLAIVKDITKQKATEQALRNSEARFNLFMDASPVVASIRDEQGRYTYMNTQKTRLLGLGEDDWQGKTDFDILPSAKAEFESKHDHSVLSANKPVEFVEEQQGNAGGLEAYSWQRVKFPFKDASQNNFIGEIAIDISQLMQMKTELSRHQNQLEEMVEERTQELRKVISLMSGREVRMAALKKEIEELKAQFADGGR